MSTLETLIAARELLSDEKRWTRGVYARDADGDGRAAASPNAVCWCSMGAVGKITNHPSPGHFDSINRLLLIALRELGFTHRSIGAFNDDLATSHADVLAVFDRAIERERG